MIGVFDSGSGGLTVLKAIKERLPSVDILYFGDIKNAPYGSRSREELSVLTVEAIRFLTEHGATSIVSACNSVSASLAVSLFETIAVTPDRLIEMVGPTVSQFRHSSARLLLCATPATIDSGIYQNAFHMLGKEVRVVPIPDLAGMIEHGATETEIENMLTQAFHGIHLPDFDVLILACTHYPLVMDAFRRVLGDSIHLFDPADAVAERVEREWWPKEAGDGSLRFCISQDSALFRSRVAELFPGSEANIEVVD